MKISFLTLVDGTRAGSNINSDSYKEVNTVGNRIVILDGGVDKKDMLMSQCCSGGVNSSAR